MSKYQYIDPQQYPVHKKVHHSPFQTFISTFHLTPQMFLIAAVLLLHWSIPMTHLFDSQANLSRSVPKIFALASITSIILFIGLSINYLFTQSAQVRQQMTQIAPYISIISMAFVYVAFQPVLSLARNLIPFIFGVVKNIFFFIFRI